MFHTFRQFFQEGQFCDLEVRASAKDNDDDLHPPPVRGHSLVLASISKLVKVSLEHSEASDGVYHLLFPDFTHEQIFAGISAIYDRLAGEVNTEVEVTAAGFLTSLNIDFDNFVFEQEIVHVKTEEVTNEVHIKRPKKRPKKEIDDSDLEWTAEAEVKVDCEVKSEAGDEEDEDYKVNGSSSTPKRRKINGSLGRGRGRKAKWPEALGANPSPTMNLGHVRVQIDHFGADPFLTISRSEAPIAVKMTVNSANQPYLTHLTTRQGSLQVLLALKEHEGMLFAKPLAWSSPGKDYYIHQMNNACAVFKSLYGLSDVQMFTQRCIYSYQHTGTVGHNRDHACSDINKLYANKFTRNQLEEVVNSLEVTTAFAEYTPSMRKLVLPSDRDWRITIDHNLNMFDDICVVGCHEDVVICRLIDASSARDKEDLAGLCLKVLNLVWGGGEKDCRVPKNDEILKKYRELFRIRYKKQCAEKLLKTEGDLPRLLPEFTCEICGKTMRENAHHTKRSLHMLQHKIEQGCDCGIVFKTKAEQRDHYYRMHHVYRSDRADLKAAGVVVPATNGGTEVKTISRRVKSVEGDLGGMVVVKCPHCDFEGSGKDVDTHVKNTHEEAVCDVCGKVKDNVRALQFHKYSQHTKKTCNICGQEFMGASRLAKHVDLEHRNGEKKQAKKAQCHICMKVCSTIYALRKHIKGVHGDESQRPFKCRECGKSFAENTKLAAHRLNMHIRNRPYVCRAEGCKSDFNCLGNLYAHEKKLHGQKFTAPVPSILDLVPPYED